MRDDTERELDREKIKIAHLVFMAKITINIRRKFHFPQFMALYFQK